MAVALRTAAGKHHATDDGKDEDCEGLHVDNKEKRKVNGERVLVSALCLGDGVWKSVVRDLKSWALLVSCWLVENSFVLCHWP